MQVKLQTLNKAVAAAATAEPLTQTQQLVTGLRIKPRTANASADVLIGDSAGQFYQVAKGTELDLTTLLMSKTGGLDTIDLNKIYVKVGTNGDSVDVVYVAKVP